MKISASVRRLFEDQVGKNIRLRTTVDEQIRGLKRERWHYESRIKTLPSFALKIESGRFQKPEALEDFFAGTLVVSNAAELDDAEKLIRNKFFLVERRPQRAKLTHKRPDNFPFDDLRLYIRIPHLKSMPKSDLMDITFELQIKTFLQHAWSIATHDLIYKSDKASWGTERIAYQTKAMLEHAEVSIQEAQTLASCSILGKQDQLTKKIKLCIDILKEHWEINELPDNLRQLAHNLVTLLDELGIQLTRLKAILSKGRNSRSGAHPSNLSPYGVILQYLFLLEGLKMEELLKRELSGSARPRVFRIFIPDEVEIPTSIDRASLVNAIFIS